MTTIKPDSLLPRYCHNTAVSCLTCLCDVLQLDLPFSHVAGFSGEAFRFPAFAGCAPGAWQHSQGWPQAALYWLELLGMDAQLEWMDNSLSLADGWAARQYLLVSDTLSRGLPVMYWDSLGWSLVLGADDAGYLSSGLPDSCRPDGTEDSAFTGVNFFGREGHGEDGAFRIGRDALCSLQSAESLFIYPLGRLPLDRGYRLGLALQRAADELAGRVGWPRLLDSLGNRLEPLFGAPAMERLATELRDDSFSLEGLSQYLSTTLEMRRAGQLWLRDMAGSSGPGIRPRLEQAAEFTRRVVEALRPFESSFSKELDPRSRRSEANRRKAVDVLYEIRRTEETLSRLLRGIATDIIAPA